MPFLFWPTERQQIQLLFKSMGDSIRQFFYQLFESVKPVDLYLFKKINQEWTASWADTWLPILTDLHKTNWFFYVLPALLFLVLFKKFKVHTVTILLGLILCLAINDWSGAKVKRNIPRPRPFQVTQTTAAVQKSPAGENNSFYSNHASNNFAAAAYLSFFMPVLSWVFFPIAFLIGYSRIYNGVHYPSDVLIGALMGLIWGQALSHFASRFIAAELRKRVMKEHLEEQTSAMKKNLRPD